MLINLVLLFVIIWNFFIGFRRGIILQIIYLLAGLVSLIIASRFYTSIIDIVMLWIPYSNPNQDSVVNYWSDVSLFALDQVYYAGLSFAIITMACYLLARFIGIFIHIFDITKLNTIWTRLASGLIAIMMTLAVFSMLFAILATVPLAGIQNSLESSAVVRVLIEKIPFFSNWIREFWTVGILAA